LLSWMRIRISNPDPAPLTPYCGSGLDTDSMGSLDADRILNPDPDPDTWKVNFYFW
jgi:hypothetical protein